MCKSIVVAAALATLAGASAAQVTLSGSADFAVQRTNGQWQAGTAGAGRNQITIFSKEDLGGGLAAFAQLHHRFRLTNGTSSPGGNFGSADEQTTQFWRNSFVGLMGSFGEVRLGRQVMPLHMVNGAFDPFGTDYLGGVHTNGIKATVRANNSIEYISPNIAGFSAMAAIAAGEGQLVSGAKSERPFGFNVRYESGPVDVAVAYDSNADDLKTTAVFGSYKLDSGVKFMTQYDRGDWTKTLKVSRWSVGVNVPVGAALLRAGYISKNGENLKKLGLGADYFLSKRTSVYSDISKQSGDGNLQTALVSALERKVRFEVGMRHRF